MSLALWNTENLTPGCLCFSSAEQLQAWEPNHEALALDPDAGELDVMMPEDEVQRRSRNPMIWLCSTMLRALHAMVS